MINKFKTTVLRRFYKSIYKPGHYYSCIPNLDEVVLREKEIFSSRKPLDIDLNMESQLDSLYKTKRFESSIPYLKTGRKPKLRYKYSNNYFINGDANILYLFLRYFTPNKIVEIGSGFSSAVMLDTNELFFNNAIDLTFVEPFPEERLNKLVRNGDLYSLTKSKVQCINKSLFTSLKRNDILFIDSSHVSKVGSDVNHIFFEIFPILKSGVIIHMHDICYPFEYPVDWIKEGRFWNESYLLRAFLMNSDQYEIVSFNNYLFGFHQQWFKENMPSLFNNSGGSFWMRKK